jgi:hypothetical protein
LSLLRPHLTEANCTELLDAARHASKRDVERLIATIAPRPDVPAVIRKLPAHPPAMLAPPELAGHVMAPLASSDPTVHLIAVPASTVQSPSPIAPLPIRVAAPIASPLSAERYKVQFTVSRETHDKLRRAQDLLRHSIPHGDPAAVVDRALTLLLEQLERTKLAQAKTPRQVSRPIASGSRHIPASVRRAVWTRDGGRCAFEGTEGRCGETGFLEFHHVVPFARGGTATVENVQLRCRAHNQHEAVEEFGERALFAREAPPAYVVNSVRTEHECCAMSRLREAAAQWPVRRSNSCRSTARSEAICEQLVAAWRGARSGPSTNVVPCRGPNHERAPGAAVRCEFHRPTMATTRACRRCGKRRCARFPRTLWTPLSASTGPAASTGRSCGASRVNSVWTPNGGDSP